MKDRTYVIVGLAWAARTLLLGGGFLLTYCVAVMLFARYDDVHDTSGGNFTMYVDQLTWAVPVTCAFIAAAVALELCRRRLAPNVARRPRPPMSASQRLVVVGGVLLVAATVGYAVFTSISSLWYDLRWDLHSVNGASFAGLAIGFAYVFILPQAAILGGMVWAQLSLYSLRRP